MKVKPYKLEMWGEDSTSIIMILNRHDYNLIKRMEMKFKLVKSKREYVPSFTITEV